MEVVFNVRESAPERLVAEAAIVFGPESGVLAGMKLVGFSLWRSPEGEAYITFPSRAFGSGSDRRFFDYLRAAQDEPDTIGQGARAKAVKAWILEQWREKGSEAIGRVEQAGRAS